MNTKIRSSVRHNSFILSLLAISVLVLINSCRSIHEALSPGEAVSARQADLSRGRQLTMLICGQCHYNSTTKKLTGNAMDDLKVLGFVYAANITNDATGAARYSDQQLRYLLRTGVKKDGKMAPFMQKPNLSDADINNIIAFLRSDDAVVQPSQEDRHTKYNMLGKIAIGSSKPLPFPATAIQAPAKNNKVEYGRYLVYNIGCYDCHSASPLKVNELFPERSKGYLGGGYKFKDETGKKVYAANITPDIETGIGKWSEADFGNAIRKGALPDGAALRAPMPKFAELSESDVSAVYAYIKTVPAIRKKRKG